MIKYCLEKWDKNQEKLKEALSKDEELLHCDYKYLVNRIVHYILNDGGEGIFYDEWSTEHIHEIDDGSYSGSLLYLIPKDLYTPSHHDYLLTYVDYGSCSGCDTLQSIFASTDDYTAKLPNEQQLAEFMDLCRHLVCNIIKPYNVGWCYDSAFDTVEY